MVSVAKKHLKLRRGSFELESEVGYPGAPKDNKTEGGKTIRRLLQAYDRHPIFSSWSRSGLIKEVLGSLFFSKKIILSRSHHNCVMTKNPHFSSRTGWHRDIRYWSYNHANLISVWLALGVETEENGCLMVVPGSHSINFDQRLFDGAGFFKENEEDCKLVLKNAKSVPLSPGDVLIFHCNLLHSAGKNSTLKTKYSLVFTYYHPENRPVAGTRSAKIKPVEIEC